MSEILVKGAVGTARSGAIAPFGPQVSDRAYNCVTAVGCVDRYLLMTADY
ncbi:MAG: hypothetical protein ACM65M_24060 [Microcoleus sp.]